MALPRKRIRTAEDLEAFSKSDAFQDLVRYMEELNEAVAGKKNDAVPVSELSPAVRDAQELIGALATLVSEIPPVKTPSRFGNPAFQTWHARMEDTVSKKTGFITDPNVALEANTYLVHSFGHRDRVDYGTGHELNFFCWIICLRKSGVFQATDATSLVTHTFRAYLALMRQLQMTYWLEPAGSHGIWGLDDYQFLPFLWGSAQLRGHPIFKPKSILNREIIEDFSKDYIYFDCIRYVNMVKTESIQWHSPLLNDIAGVRTWAKVNEGMIKMYKAEVLGKLPIMQHFLFGPSLPFPIAGEVEEEEAAHIAAGHYHDPSSRCCYHRVPSVFSTMEESTTMASDAAAASFVVPFD